MVSCIDNGRRGIRSALGGPVIEFSPWAFFYEQVCRMEGLLKSAARPMKISVLSFVAKPLASAAMVFAIVSGTAFAQDQAKPQSGSGQLEEIVVTSQKRSEDVKAIPASISVLSGYGLKAQNITDYDDLTRALPNVSYTAGPAPGLSVIEMRGVSSTSGSATVGIYVDEVPVTVRNTTYDGNTEPKLFDIDRVEVLRGPQGTLYGASSMGGTIRFITKLPDLEQYSGEAIEDLSGTIHGDVNYETTAIVNVPIAQDKFGIRAGAQYTYNSGYIDNYDIFTGTLNKTGTNDERALVGRISALAKPSDDLTITPAVFYQRDFTGDTSAFYPQSDEGFFASGIATGTYHPVFGLWEQDKQVQEWGRDTLFIPSLTVKEELGFADLTSVSSFFERQYARMQDGTYYNSTIFATVFLDGAYPDKQAQNDAQIGTLNAPSPSQILHRQITQEVRMSSPADDTGPIKWVAGLYYQNYWDNRNQVETIPGLQKTFQSIYGYPIWQDPAVGDGDPSLYEGDLIWFERVHVNERQYAAFGQADFDILPDLHGAVGMRYVYARSSESREGGGFYDLGNPHPYSTLGRYYAATPRFSVTYDVDPDTTAYITIAKGFRLGGPTGPDPVGPTSPCNQDYANLGIKTPPTTYGSDKLWSYETGVKARLFDNSLSINAAAFYIDWQDIQQTINLPICGFAFTSNVGDAESYGTELEVAYKPLPSLTLGANGSFDHAVITSTINAQTAAVGQKVLDVPDWTMDVSAEYTQPIAGDDLVGFVRVDYDWTGRSHGSYIVTNPNYGNPQYDVLDLSTGVDYGNLRVSLYGKNINNNRTIIQQPTINSVTEGFTVRPTTIGINLDYKFTVDSGSPEPATYVPPPPQAPTPAAVARSYMVFFDFNKSDLTPEAISIVDQAARNAGPAKATTLTVTGQGQARPAGSNQGRRARTAKSARPDRLWRKPRSVIPTFRPAFRRLTTSA
jgi:outer membrane receptor protein involved in Fe transport